MQILDRNMSNTVPEVDIGSSPFRIWTLLVFFYGLGMTQSYQLDHSLSLRLLKAHLPILVGHQDH